LEDTIGVLARTGLIIRLDGDNRIRVHRLVAQVTRHQLLDASIVRRTRWTVHVKPVRSRADTAGDWAEHTISILLALFPTEPWQPENWAVCAQLAGCVTAAVDIAIQHDGAAASVGTLLNKLSIYLQGRGEFNTALANLQRAVQIEEATHGPEHLKVAITLGNLANVQNTVGQLDAALHNQQRSLRIMVAVHGPEHPEVARTLNNLGSVQQDLGQLDNLQRALQIRETVYGPEHSDVARTLNKLGSVQHDLGQPDAALDSLRRALRIEETAYGLEHADVAQTLTKIGSVQQDIGQVGAAQTNLRRALRILEAAYGPQHREVIRARTLLTGGRPYA
jgi:Tfp pilus assembly protein PilF